MDETMHCRFMKLALVEAEKAFDLGEVPIGAVIVKNGKVIGKGHNTRELSESAIAHAEINAIQDACQNMGHWRLTDCVLYVTIEPCPMCVGAIYQSRIKTVYFGSRDPKGGACGSVFNLFDFQGLNHYCQIVEGVLSRECSDVMKRFFKRLR
ncbi:tRNA adenosine(34) deaminase TadA [Fusibacter sp. 3D3]|uniref:tRNA adenosine(34) deaminase TadA n=1 Tax=Fusibacter sp. 3D3 TaxID=1048380 RepID=UPI0008551AC5|nr:tRNA adenosine(34) deaminase TadA [Fusibacter sp. 3D3]GAU75773.1 tRNA-specific adenosine-34 deaminase [Fusibacter sp. 3D3]